jgi:hypothetical protein
MIAEVAISNNHSLTYVKEIWLILEMNVKGTIVQQTKQYPK